MFKYHELSVRARLTLIAGVSTTLLCLMVGAYLVFAGRDWVIQQETNEISGTALRVVHLAKRGPLPPVLPGIDGDVQVVNQAGDVVSASRSMTGRPRAFTFIPPSDSPRTERTICNSPEFPDGCVIAVGYRVYAPDDDPGRDWMIYSVGPRPGWFIHPTVPVLLVGVSALIVGVICFGTYRIVGRTLAPVDAIRREFAEITETDLGRRVPVPKNQDEIRQLADTANQTLDRLEAAVEQQRRFAADASHDLRTPLTAMRTRIEEALLDPEEANWPRTADALLDSLDRLQELVTDLLTITTLDGGGRVPEEAIDLAELAERVLHRRPPGVDLIRTLDSGVVVHGNRVRLERLLNNLLDNAERHTESVVLVSVRAEAGEAVMEVVDDGAGIPADQRERIFDRFTRLDASRNRDAGGTGLGLPIARQIAEAHGGSLTVGDSEKGARFVIYIPLRDSETALAEADLVYPVS